MIRLLMIAAFALVTGKALAQEPVVGVADPESLFTDSNPKLNTNKQAALHIMKDLLQCNHWDEADKWLTSRWRFVDGKADEHWDPATKAGT